MLQGRLSLRDGARAVLGCFILFGAPYIASGLIGALRNDAGGIVYLDPGGSIANMAAPPEFDPYAGAATPM